MCCLSSTATAQKPEPAKVKIISQPGALPVKVEWKRLAADGSVVQSGTIVGSGGEIPVGEHVVQLIVRPMHSGFLYILAEWQLDGKGFKGSNGSLAMRLKRVRPGITVTCWPIQPSPSWRGVMVRINRNWALVSMPMVDAETLKYWKEVGDRKIAESLAKAFESGKTKKNHWGKFQTESGWTLLVPSSDGSTTESLKGIKTDELIPKLVEALEIIKTQRDLTGESVLQKLAD